MATVSAWGKAGGWALDSEENEAELLQQHKDATAAHNGNSKAGDAADFPSLATAAATKTKKKKPQSVSLQEFVAYGAAKPFPDELLVLPTGPRQRSVEELERNKLGGGFRSYGGGMRDEQQRRFNRESNREPSRADETDNWMAGKRSSVNSGFERRDRGERGGFFTDSQSKADEVDNWASNKSFVPSEPRRYDRRGSFGLESSNGGADSDNWSKRKEEDRHRVRGAFDSLREKRGGFESNGADSENWGRKRDEGIVGGRPKLNLQPRTLPVQKDESAPVVKPKGSSPFGNARPREEVLKEKGQDWKEIEQKLEATKIATDGSAAVAKKSFWSGNRRDMVPQEDKTVRPWTKPESVNTRPLSPDESETGTAENKQADDSEERDAQA